MTRCAFSMLIAGILAGGGALLAQEPVHFVQVAEGEEWVSQDPEGLAAAAEIEAVIARTSGDLVLAVPEAGSDAAGLIEVSYATDRATGAVLQQMDFPASLGTSSHVVFLDTARGSYRVFSLDPTGVAADAARISQHIQSRDPGFRADVTANLLDLHGRRIGLAARARTLEAAASSEIRDRRPFCTMTSNVEVDTWEPARLPVAITEMATLALGYPSHLHLTRWGRCWAAPLVNVRWDFDWWTTTWHLHGCRARRIQQSGSRFIAAVQGQMYNDDFPFNTSRVWVSHIIKTYHDDHSGNIWYRAWAGTAGGVSQTMLASGVNIATTYVSTNCNL